MIRVLITSICFILFSTCLSFAACDCGSTDSSSPCVGQSITVDVATNLYSWTFNSGGGDARCGQFANGDFWVAPALGQSSVTITSVTGSGPITVDADPHPGSVGLLDGSPAWSGYASGENILPNLPLSYSAATSLVAAIQRNEITEGACGAASIVGSCVDSYNVVTILNDVPVNAGAYMIRPNITGTNKEYLTLSDFDFTRIPSLSFLTGADSSGLENIRKRWSNSIEIFSVNWSKDAGATWYPNSYGNVEEGRAYRSAVLVDNYAAGTAAALHADFAVLFSDKVSPTDKIKPLSAILAYGLDMYHAVFDPPPGYVTKWGTGAGQHLGKFSSVVMLAALEKNNQTRLTAIKSVSSLATPLQPQELAQLHVGANGPVWGDDVGLLAYWTDLFNAGCYDGSPSACNTSTGSKTGADPYSLIDGPATSPGESYFRIGYAGILNFAAIMHMMPTFKQAVNATKVTDFVDRARTYGLKTLPDPCVAPDPREQKATCNVWTRGTGCSYYYPSALISQTWGPKSLTDIDQGCVTTAIPGYTQQGRFSRLDGTPANINTGYTTPQLYYNWQILRNVSTSPINTIPKPSLFRLR